MTSLHNNAASFFLGRLRIVGVIVSIDLSPHRRYHVVFGLVAVVHQADNNVSMVPYYSRAKTIKAYLIEASETLTLGLSRSSFNRPLSSCNLLSFNSAMLCFFAFASPPSRAYAVGILNECVDNRPIQDAYGSSRDRIEMERRR